MQGSARSVRCGVDALPAQEHANKRKPFVDLPSRNATWPDRLRVVAARGMRGLRASACLCLLLCAGVAHAQTFNCAAGDFYQVFGSGNTGTFARVNRTQTPYTLQTIYTTTPLPLNSIAYNGSDNYVYALRSTVTLGEQALYRLGTSGLVDLNGALPGEGAVVAGLPGMTLNSGEIDSQGNYFVTPNLLANTLYRITGLTGATPAPVALQVPVSPDTSAPAGFSASSLTSPGDFSLNPVESAPALSVLYGIAGTTLYRVAIDNPSGPTPTARVSSRATTLPAGPSVGATYFDAPNVLYAYGNNVGFYTIDIGSGTAVKVSNATTTARSDGARCPNAPAAIPPTVELRKITTGATGGPFAFTLANTAQASGTVTTAAANTAAQVDGDPDNGGVQPFTVSAFDTAVTITESGLPPGWVLTGAVCTDNGVTVGSLGTGAQASTYTIPAGSVSSGKQFVCTFSNRQLRADLVVTKTNNTGNLVSGTSTVYEIVLDNNGPDAADGAVVTDPPATGLDCSAGPLTCTASNGAQCPGGTINGPPVNVPVASLQAGVPVPVLPAGGHVVFALTCAVTNP